MNVDNNYMEVENELLEQEFGKCEVEAQGLLGDDDKFYELIEKVDNICDKLSILPGIGKYITSIPTLLCMIKDYKENVYKEIPLASIIMILAALIYLVLPMDVVPDNIPILGLIDDIKILEWTLDTIQGDIKRYCAWAIREDK